MIRLDAGWVDQLPRDESDEWRALRERGLRPFKVGDKRASITRGAGRGGRSKRISAKLDRLLGKVDE